MAGSSPHSGIDSRAKRSRLPTNAIATLDAVTKSSTALTT